MGERAKRYVRDARAAADWLEAKGQPKLANDVRNACRSNDGYRATLEQLHRDNMELRAQLAAATDQGS